MRKTLTLFVLLLITSPLLAQNLVPNPSFELHNGCNLGLSGVQNWYNPDTATPDWYHACAPNIGGFGLSVPYNILGFQHARTGQAYMGFIVYEDAPIFGCPNVLFASGWREYVAVQLTSPLQAGQNYCVEFWVSRSDGVRYASDDMGVYLSASPVQGLQTARALPFTPQVVNTTGVISDTMNWTQVSGFYTAQGGEQYIVIGNFKNDQNTTATCINNTSFNSFAYYYLDDVFVGPGNCQTPCALTANIGVAFPGCDVNNITGTATPTGGNGPYTYLWSNGGNTQTVAGLPTGSVSVTVTDALGCQATATTTITAPVLPNPSLGPDTSICLGESVTLTAHNGIVYSWSTGANTPSITASPTQTSWFWAIATDANGCRGDDSILVTVNPLPVVFTIPDMNPLNPCDNDPSFLLQGGNPAGGTFSGTGVSNNNFDPATAGAGTHTIFYNYTDPNGCSGVDSFDILVRVCSTAVEETTLPWTVSVYPNPSGGTFRVALDGAFGETWSLRLIDAAGREAGTWEVLSGQNVMDIVDLPAGMYFGRVSVGKDRRYVRVSVTR